MRAFLWFCFISAAGLMVAGCGPTADQPLVDPQTARQDPRLYGSWINEPDAQDGNQFLHIGDDYGHQDDPNEKPGLMQSWLIASETKRMAKDAAAWKVYSAAPPMGFKFVPIELGETWVASIGTNASLPEPWAKALRSETEVSESNGERYWFLKYAVEGDRLKIWPMDDLFVARAIEEGRLKGKVEPSLRTFYFGIRRIQISDSQENLRRFFEQNLDKGLFSSEPSAKFRRIQGP